MPLLSCVPPASLIYEALGMADGARKYGPYNWRKTKVILSIYIDACLRHLLAFYDGEEVAPDSGVPHLAHAKANLGIIIDALQQGGAIDDRPPKGAAGKLLEEWACRRQAGTKKKASTKATRGTTQARPGGKRV